MFDIAKSITSVGAPEPPSSLSAFIRGTKNLKNFGFIALLISFLVKFWPTIASQLWIIRLKYKSDFFYFFSTTQLFDSKIISILIVFALQL
jgi:hypothetical protein